MKAVSELRRTDRKARFTCNKLFAATTRSTPATFDDLFIELFMDKLTTQDELNGLVAPTLD